MATKGTVTFVTLDDLAKRAQETYPYEVADFGMVEMRGITHRDMREVRAKHEDATGAILDFPALCEDLAKRACATPRLTDEIVESMVDAERVLRVIGHHAGHRAGYLTNPPEQDIAKAESEADPTAPPAGGTSTAT